MVLGGLWHGADLSFVLWGFIHGIFISASHFAKSINMPKMPDWILWLLTFNAVSLAWIFFRTPSSEAAFNIIGRIIRLEQFPATSISMTTLLILSLSIAGHLSGKCSLKFKFISRLSLRPTWQIMAFYSLVFISIVIGEQHFHPFIYFQF
jgi:D-alanyl-lipoteichoic acid acyltransferase DltB (MBOAT superfamily)